MSGSNHPSLVKIPDMALPHVFVPCVDILLKLSNLFLPSDFKFLQVFSTIKSKNTFEYYQMYEHEPKNGETCEYDYCKNQKNDFSTFASLDQRICSNSHLTQHDY